MMEYRKRLSAMIREAGKVLQQDAEQLAGNLEHIKSTDILIRIPPKSDVDIEFPEIVITQRIASKELTRLYFAVQEGAPDDGPVDDH